MVQKCIEREVKNRFQDVELLVCLKEVKTMKRAGIINIAFLLFVLFGITALCYAQREQQEPQANKPEQQREQLCEPADRRR